MRNIFQVNAENYTDRQHKRAIWYKFLSVLCCIVVFCTTYAMVLPAITLEETQTGETPTEQEIDPNAVVMEKKIKYDEATNGFTIRIESYVTGSVQYVSKVQPSDIVLVLDASGSMDDGTLRMYNTAYDISINGTYYRFTDNRYRRVYYCSECGGWYTSSHDGACGGHSVSGSLITPKTSQSDENGVQFYVNEGNYTNMEALKKYASAFVASVAEISPENRVAIVKFAEGDSSYVHKDPTVTGNTKSHTQVVQGLTELSQNNVNVLKNSINAITPSGDTASDWGLYLADQLLANAKKTAENAGKTYDRNQVVIMFTDGEPNHGGDGLNTTVANDAIANAKKLKAGGAKVYTIGCFSNADATVYDPATDNDGWNSLSSVNKYMNLVSSNFKTADSLTSTGTATYPEDVNSYYRVVADSQDMAAEFEAISIEIGKAAVQLDDTTELNDYISEQYNLAITETNGVYIHTETYKGKNADGSLIWEDDKNGPKPEGLTVTVQDGIKKDGASGLVTVTGFDYSEYFVDFDASPSAAHVGKKLVVDIPISPSDDVPLSGMVKTNAPGSGLYYGGEEIGEGFPFPDVEIPATVNVKLTSKHVADIYNNSINVKVTGATDAAAYREAGKEYSDHVYLSDATETTFSLGGKTGPLTQELYAIDHIAKEETPIDVVFDITNIPKDYLIYAKLDSGEPELLPVKEDGSAVYKMQPTGTMNLEFIVQYSPVLKLTVVNETKGATADDIEFSYNISYDDYDGNPVSKDFTLKMNTSSADLSKAISELNNIPNGAAVTLTESGYDGFTVLFRNTDNETLHIGDSYLFTMNDNLTIVVQNTAGQTLPATGSFGTLFLTVIGISLISFAVICALVLKLKRKEGKQ